MKLPKINFNFGKAPRYAKGVVPLAPSEAAIRQRFVTSNSVYAATNPETGEQKFVAGEGYGIYLMRPHKFLSLAASLTSSKNQAYVKEGVAPEKNKLVEKRLNDLSRSIKEKGLESIPFLQVRQNEVVGHEGRHRALAAIELGKKFIPVHVIDTQRYYKPHLNIDTDRLRPQSRGVSTEDALREINEPQAIKEYEQIESQIKSGVKRKLRKEEDKQFDYYYNKVYDLNEPVERLQKTQEALESNTYLKYKREQAEKDLSLPAVQVQMWRIKDKREEKQAADFLSASQGKMPGAIKPFVKVDFPNESYHVSASPKVKLKEGHNIVAGRESYGPRKGFYVGNDPATWMDVLGKENVANKEGKTFIYPVDMSRLDKKDVSDSTGKGWKRLNQELAVRRGKELGLDAETINRVATPPQEQKIEASALKKVTLGKPIVAEGKFEQYWAGYNDPGFKTWQWGADVDRTIAAHQITTNKEGEKGTPLYPTILKPREQEQSDAWKEAKRENRIKEVETRDSYNRNVDLIPKQGGYPVQQEYVVVDAKGKEIEQPEDVISPLYKAFGYEPPKDEPQVNPIPSNSSIIPRERPKDYGVAFSAVPDEPSIAKSDSAMDMFMTKEGRRLSKDYAGSEEEQDEELKSLYGSE